jgi:hypothetical protein
MEVNIMKQRVWSIFAIWMLVMIWTNGEVFASEFGNFTLSTGVCFDYFKENSSQELEGKEFTYPLVLAYEWGWLSLNLTTAYSSVTVDPLGQIDPLAALSSKLDSLTDTFLSGTYTFPELAIGMLTVGIDVNLPTGSASLGQFEWNSEIGENHDLLRIDDFGEGWNVGLNLGLIRELGPVIAGVNGSYVYNGIFDPTSDAPDDELDPGDQFLLTTLVNWEASQRVILDGSLSYSYYTPDTVEGEKSFQQGGNLTLSNTLNWQYSEVLGFMLSLQNSLPFKNKEWDDDTFTTEPDNSNAYETSGALSVSYTYSERLRFQTQTDIRYYAESKRQDAASGLPYSGKRVRYAFGGGMSFQMKKYLFLNGGATYFQMDQDRDVNNKEDTTYQGINLELGVTCTF